MKTRQNTVVDSEISYKYYHAHHCVCFEVDAIKSTGQSRLLPSTNCELLVHAATGRRNLMLDLLPAKYFFANFEACLTVLVK